MKRALRIVVLLLMLSGSRAPAQVFVLDPYFGTGGIATYEWPAANGYQWNTVDAWAARLPDGKWALATQLRDGTSQIMRSTGSTPMATSRRRLPGPGRIRRSRGSSGTWPA
jgi:hypothetical protein